MRKFSAAAVFSLLVITPSTASAWLPDPPIAKVLGPFGAYFDFGHATISEVFLNGKYYHLLKFEEPDIDLDRLLVSRNFDFIKTNAIPENFSIVVSKYYKKDDVVHIPFTFALDRSSVSGELVSKPHAFEDYPEKRFTDRAVKMAVQSFMLCRSDRRTVLCWPLKMH